MSTLVSGLMRRNVLSVSGGDPVARAMQIMLWAGVRHLPVLRSGRLEGVITERDIFRRQAEHGAAAGGIVGAVMSAPAHYTDPDEPVAIAAERMAAHKIGCLPVLEKGVLQGILTTTDILRAQLASSAATEEEEGESRGWAAREVMTPSPVTTTPDEYLVNAIAKMSLARIRHLPVVDDGDRIVGMLSDRDVGLCSQLSPAGTRNLRDERMRVRSAMSTNVITVRPGAPPSVLFAAFTDWRLGSLPVTDQDGRLLGIVSYIDLLNQMAKRDGDHV
jgi:CBS domain-containing protein